MKADLEQPDEQSRLGTNTPTTGIEARWQRITELVASAWELPASMRQSYISEHCGSDASMCEEVENLLQQLGDSSALLRTGALEISDLGIPDIAPGTLLGRYRVQEKIGEGGMGVVYRAHDELLDRIVALKVLRRRLVDPQFRERLLREAQMTAALTHPNIVTVYDTGSSGEIDFIVMEYVSGVALNELIPRGPLRIHDAIRYSRQIASALAKAHSAGIVHRDLKPGNVILAEDGTVKVLDFGLAKRLAIQFDPVLLDLDSSSRKHESSHLNQTVQGAVLGTLAYMSPEQARGDPVDECSDIFSFGAILFELVSGHKAFRFGSLSEILSAIGSGRVPRLADGPRRVPQALDDLVARCMQKDARQRPRAAEIVLTLQALENPPRTKTWIAAAAALTILAITFSVLLLKPSAQIPEVQLSARPLTSDPGDEIGSSFSPDGKQVVFSWRREDENNFNLYVMPVAGGPPIRLTVTAFDDLSPVWSPDGRYIAFIRGASGQPASILFLPAAGGSPRQLTTMSSTPWMFRADLDWSPDSKWIAFADEDHRAGNWGIFAVALQTRERRTLAAPSRRGVDYIQPVFSPNGRELAFSGDQNGVSQLRLLRLKSDGNPDGASWPIRMRGFQNAISNNPMWRHNGRELLFFSNKSGSGGHLWTVDVTNSQHRELVPYLIGSLEEGAVLPALSRKGNFLAFTRVTQDKNIWRVSLSSPEAGQLTKLISSTRQENFPEYSPDGRRVAFESDRSGFPEVWISNADGSGPFALTHFNGPVTGSPAWSPDGTQIAFGSAALGTPEVFVIRAEPGAKPRQVTFGGGPNFVPCWSADGGFIFFTSTRTGNSRIWRIPAQGGQAQQITNSLAFAPHASPDGKYLYFMAGRSDASDIRQFDLTTGQETRIAGTTTERSFSVTARGVYYLHSLDAHAEVLRFWNPVTKQESPLARITGRLAGGLSVSSDGRFALLVKDDRGGADLMLVENFN